MNQREENHQKAKTPKLIMAPRAIYFETSVLYTFPLDVMTANMQALQNLSKQLEFALLIPEVCLLQWIISRKEKVKKYIGNCRELSSFFSHMSRNGWSKDAKSLIEDTQALTEEILQVNCIKSIPIPEISSRDLVLAAIKKTKPFEEKDKGFKDYMILQSIFEYAKRFKGGTHVLVARDKVFEVATKKAAQIGINLVLYDSLDKTIENLEKFCDDQTLEEERRKEQLLRDYLKRKKAEISQYIYQNAEVTDEYLKIRYQYGFLLEVTYIHDIEVMNIPSVRRGSLATLDNKGRVKISFTVDTRISFTATEVPYRPVICFKEGKRISPLPIERFLGNAITGYGIGSTISTSVPGRFSLEGSAILQGKKNSEGKVLDTYSDLDFESVGLE